MYGGMRGAYFLRSFAPNVTSFRKFLNININININKG